MNHRLVWSAVVVLGLLLIVMIWPEAKAEQSPVVSAIERVQPSVGALYSREAGGDMSFLCSATAVGRHGGQTVILSANHCLKKGVSYLVNFGDSRLRPANVWKIPHYEVDAEKFPRQYGEPQTDMALFLMDGVDIPTVEIAEESESIAVGRSVVMVGYPLGVAKIAYEGILAGRFDLPGNDQHGYLLLQIFGAPGSSGSSVIDTATGKVVAILVAAKQSPVGLPVIFATPIEYQRYLQAVRDDEGQAVAGLRK